MARIGRGWTGAGRSGADMGAGGCVTRAGSWLAASLGFALAVAVYRTGAAVSCAERGGACVTTGFERLTGALSGVT
ncbi:MAG: hypothetical protein COW55_14715, partial [Rhodobacteraceae bacterium CG17_big_fil_post_rev_8_21_14_2_50_65_11]